MPESKNYSSRYLDWDTDFFGVKSGRIELFNEVTVTEQREILEALENFEFTTIYNHNNNNENNAWIGEKLTASLKDVNVQFSMQLKEQNHDVDKDENIEIKNNLGKNDDIISIAENSFLYSRFYNDKKLNQDKAAKIYRQWVTSAFNRESKFFLYYKLQERIIGFVLFSLNDSEATIELIAVDKLSSGKGIGNKMIRHLKKHLFNNDIEVLNVGTQVNNINAINFYIASGFKYSHCASVYHHWKSQ